MRNLMLAFLLPVALALGACGDMGKPANPMATAQTIDQKAFALAGLFAIVKEEAADVAITATTPRGVVLAIRDANRLVSPLVRTMVVAAREYSLIAAEIDAVRKAGGTPAQEKMAAAGVALSRLTKAYSDAEPQVQNFIAAVTKAKGGTP